MMLDISSVIPVVMEDIVGVSMSKEWITQYLNIFIFPQTDCT